MKKLLALCLVISFSSCAQDKPTAYWPEDKLEATASNVVLPSSLTQQQQQNLEILCRVWGFLKYFHPKPAKGLVNVDKALFLILPEVLDAPDKEALQNLLSKWVKALGDIPEYDRKTESKPLHVFIEPSMGWLQKDSLLSGELRRQLQYVFEHRYWGESYYAYGNRWVGNPDLSREFRYRQVKGEDGGMRMLALFRFWNMIEYFFPSKYLTADNWDSTLQQFIPRFAAPQSDSSYRMRCYEMVAAIHDTHAAGIGNDTASMKYIGENILPAAVSEIEGSMVVTRVYGQASPETGLMPGDKIMFINGEPVQKHMDAVRPFISASNNTALNKYSMFRMGQSRQKTNRITIERDGKTLALDIAYISLQNFYDPKNGFSNAYPYPMHRQLADNIGYINLAKIKADSVPVIFEQFAGTRGLVIDIRNYPAEFVPFTMGKWLKPEPSIFVRFTKPDYSLPGRFLMIDSAVNGEKDQNYYKGRIVILVNEESISQSEYTAMSFQNAPNAVVMGSQTLGADGNVSRFYLPGSLVSMFSGLGVYYPDGRVTQGPGIVPDIVVRPTIKGLAAGRDEVLEAAVKYIHENPVK